jgi:hypothetical protein
VKLGVVKPGVVKSGVVKPGSLEAFEVFRGICPVRYTSTSPTGSTGTL